MFSSYPVSEKENVSYAPNVYPWQHIHPTKGAATTTKTGLKPTNKKAPSTKKSGNATARPRTASRDAPPVVVRELAGPRVCQEPGHGPFHTVRPDARRFDFRLSKPSVTDLARNMSLIDPPLSSREEASLEEHPIRLFAGGSGGHVSASAAADPLRARPRNVQSENNDPLSACAHVKLERCARDRDDGYGTRAIESTLQPRISAGYITRRTEQMRAAKQEQIEQYQRDVQERLKRRSEEKRREESQRRAALPTGVQTLVYSMKPTPAPAQQQEVADMPPPPAQNLAEFLAQASPQRQNQGRARSPSPVAGSYTERRSSPVRPATAGAATARSHIRPSKQEAAVFSRQVRKAEMARARAQIREARAEGGLVPTTDSARTGVAFGLGIFPRHARSPVREAELVSVVRHHATNEPAAHEEATLEAARHTPAPAFQPRMSASRKKTGASASSGGPASAATNVIEKHATYRRLLLERLHALAATLGHPLPPLCACGFTASDEYDLLFAYGGHVQTAAVAPPPQQSQPPFNLSTVIAQTAHHDSSVHTHSTAAAAAAATPSLPTHVLLDATRHGFQHKRNCNFHQAPDAYVKAMASLLHTLEDQQQI